MSTMPWIRVTCLTIWLALIPLCSCDLETCSIINKNERFDCHPDASPSTSNCNSRGCCWQPVTDSGDAGNVRQLVDVPYCFFPRQYSGYNVTSWKETDYGFTASLSRSTPSGWPMDIKILSLDIWFETEKRIHFKVGGNLCFILFLIDIF